MKFLVLLFTVCIAADCTTEKEIAAAKNAMELVNKLIQLPLNWIVNGIVQYVPEILEFWNIKKTYI